MDYPGGFNIFTRVLISERARQHVSCYWRHVLYSVTSYGKTRTNFLGNPIA